jgi:hypothetical protein
MSRKFVPQAAALVRRRPRFFVATSLPVVLAAVVVAVAGGSGAATIRKGATRATGIARASAAGTTSSLAAAAATTATSGPQVIQDTFQGVSPDVSSLPVLPVPQSPIQSREIESLKPSAAPAGTKDPVVQGKKGSGPISTPIQNFDGICLPFGEPCALLSSCGCLPPDTNGEVGPTQYVQMVNTDFAIFSKSGAVLRTATPINELWANSDGECKTHNDGDPVVV